MNQIKNILIRIFKIALGIELFWLVFANLFLNTGLGPWAINFKPEKFSLQWDSAWTLYPARIHTTGLRASIHTWTMDVEVQTDQATASIKLLPLLTKRLVVNGIRAGSVSIALEREVPEGVRPAPTKTTPGLLIDLRDMEVGKVDRFSFNQLTVDGGEAHATGSASFRIRGEVEVTDVNASWQNAKIQLGDAELAESLSVDFHGGLDSFFPKQDKGLALLAKLSGLIDIKGSTGSLVPLQLLFPEVAWIERIDGEGDVDVRLDLLNGKLQPGSIVDVEAKGLELDFLGFRATGSGTVDAEVRETSDQRTGEINLVFSQFGLQRQGETAPLVTGQGLSLQAKASELGVVEQLGDFELVLEIPDSEMPDISFLANRLPKSMDVTVNEGKATLKGRMKVSGVDKEAQGKFQLSGEGLKGRFRNMDYDMDLELTSRVSGKQLDDFRVELQGTEFKLFNGTFDNEAVEVDKLWWMTVSVPEGFANLAEPVELDAEVDLSMKDTRAVIAMFAEVKDWIRHFDGILTVNDVTGGARLTAANQQLSIRELELGGDRLDFMAELQLSEEENNGIFWGKLGILSFGLERIGQETNWKMINGREWYEEQKAKNWLDKMSTESGN
jgi:hypothetical protein